MHYFYGYDIIENVLANFDQNYQIIKTMLVPIKDLVKISRQILLNKISPKTVYQLYSGILGAKTIYHFILGNPCLHEYLKKRIPDNEHLLDYIDEFSCKLDLKCNYFLIKHLDEFNKFINKYNYDKRKINILTSLIWINMASLHEYPLSNFLFNFGKYNLYFSIN